MKVFNVTITETLKKTVQIKANNHDEAEQIASDNWRSSEYILDAECFSGVAFKAEVIQKSKDYER